MIPQAALDAVTDAANMSSFGVPGASERAVRDTEVVAELGRLEDLSAEEARRLGREAVESVGGRIEPRILRGGLAAGRRRDTHDEVWWVPCSAIRM